MKRLALVAALAVSGSALAYESACREYPDVSLDPAQYAGQTGTPCLPDSGPNAVRQRWIGGLDEHRRLFEEARRQAGLPDAVAQTIRFRVFTSNSTVTFAGKGYPTLRPAPFEEAVRAQTRVTSLAELAQLPDYSYSLWDWATGNETCPLPGVSVTSESCHEFAAHMGPVNANHFVPLAQDYYTRHHALAMSRAAECKTLQTKLGAELPRFIEYAKACELSALMIEAVAQHYLQDAWSVGHMWQRWGSPELSDFPGDTVEEQRDRAVLVALVSGLIHGARGVLQKLPAWTTFDVNDALCAPHPKVEYVTTAGARSRGVGDDYLEQLTAFGGPNTFAAQSSQLLSCSASGMTAVYRAAGENHGALAPLPGVRVDLDPTSAECFGQRATNAAMLEGMAVQLRAAGQQLALTLDSRVVSWMLPKVARAQGAVPVSPKLRNQFRLGMQRAVSLARVFAKLKPEGTELAEGGMGPILGAKPNGAYAGKARLASYEDPPLPWPSPPDAMEPNVSRAAALARTMHRAHAEQWCESVSATTLSSLKAHANDGSLDPDGKAAACESCVEIAKRHLRIGASGAYDAAREPLCHYLSDTAAYVYESGGAAEDLGAIATRWCGCP